MHPTFITSEDNESEPGQTQAELFCHISDGN